MEMDSVELGQDGQGILEDTSADKLLSQGSPHRYDVFGDSPVIPRIGDQYQVEIPPLLTESERLQLMKNPIDSEVIGLLFAMGLSIPIMWMHEEVENVKHEHVECLGDPISLQNFNRFSESEISKEIQTKLNIEHPNLKVEDFNVKLGSGKRSRALKKEEHDVGGIEIDQMEPQLFFKQNEESNLDHKYSSTRCSPLPGSMDNSWSDTDLESFLLGLYIFGKNLVQVKNFVESKKMGNILSFYYGKFYGSERYQRWSECKKIKSRRCIHGERIFTGWRQQELLSRLLPCVSKECQNTLVEVSRKFTEGKILLEEYVFFLKATVGLKTLIEAIGLGKRKRNLTGMMDPVKTNQVSSFRQEIPTVRDCNSLSSGDIIKYLTGDFRLSKAKSNDLFWEAVWPRLLDRGWRSEEPKNCVGSKNTLVFIIPGVKKFSKRRLVKGNHYFDSVTDVLNKVASDPGLLEAVPEVPRGSTSNEENLSDKGRKLDQNGSSVPQCHGYLQPKNSNGKSDVMKFTVIDTSLCREEGRFKIRELRTLPVDVTSASTPTSLSKETDRGSSEDPEDEPESVDRLSNGHVDSITSRRIDDMVARKDSPDLSDSLVSKRRRPLSGRDTTNSTLDNNIDRYTNACNDKYPRKTLKRQSSRRVKPGKSKYLTPITKQRRLTACERAESTIQANVFSACSDLKQKDSNSLLASPSASENVVSEVGPSWEKVSNGSSSKGSPNDRIQGILSENCAEKPKPRGNFDLNLPHVEEDVEASGPSVADVADNQGDQKLVESCSLVETNKVGDPKIPESNSAIIHEEQQPAVNARRQGTRNRPLTVKALEAVACGFLSTKRKWRGTENANRRPSRRARGSLGATVCIVAGVDEGVDEASSSNTNTNIISNPQVESERKVAHELLGVPNLSYHLIADGDN